MAIAVTDTTTCMCMCSTTNMCALDSLTHLECWSHVRTPPCSSELAQLKSGSDNACGVAALGLPRLTYFRPHACRDRLRLQRDLDSAMHTGALRLSGSQLTDDFRLAWWRGHSLSEHRSCTATDIHDDASEHGRDGHVRREGGVRGLDANI